MLLHKSIAIQGNLLCLLYTGSARNKDQKLGSRFMKIGYFIGY